MRHGIHDLQDYGLEKTEAALETLTPGTRYPYKWPGIAAASGNPMAAKHPKTYAAGMTAEQATEIESLAQE